jgi:Tfp pilus assembly protein PilV
MTRRFKNRGVSLVEALVSLTVFSFGLIGVTSLHLISSRSNAMMRRMSQATELAQDLVENIGLWPYNDPRLVPSDNITAINNALVSARIDLGQATSGGALLSKPNYAEQATTLAVNPSALYNATTQYDGYTADVDGDGVPDFERYWSVFNVNLANDGLTNGKLVVVTVRWMEPALGRYRQITSTTFVSNSGNFGQ